jgi:thiosulfate/3-mercaptopyruvate sulfurtransferase
MALVDVPTLVRQLSEAAPPTVIDVRWRLGGPPGAGQPHGAPSAKQSREGYLAGHIPGAVFLDLNRDVAGPPGALGRHPLPEPGALQAALRAAGVQGRSVVVYDEGEGTAAARLWWTLRWAGHAEVAVLDGGLGAWVAAGQPLQEGDVTPEPGDVVVRPGGMPVLDADGAATVARSGVLLDVRAAVRYRGEQEPIDPVAGHIPGAVNVPATTLVDETGRLLPPEALRRLLPASGGAAVGAYCGSGVTAAQAVLAFEVAGLGTPALYVGSWSEWVADASRPVATGEQP